MKKTNKLIMIFILLIAILLLPNMVKADILRRGTNQWIEFPSSINRSWMTNWDGFYTWSGTLTKLTTSDDVTFKIQTYCISTADVNQIQEKSDATPDDDEFKDWLKDFVNEYIDDTKWSDLNNMDFTFECKSTEEHTDHLVYIKVLENEEDNIVWQGYRTRLFENFTVKGTSKAYIRKYRNTNTSY